MAMASTAATAATVVVQNGSEKVPKLIFGNEPVRLMTPHLFVQRIQQLLTGRRPRESRPLVERAAKSTTIQESFTRAVEGDAHAIEEYPTANGPAD